MATDDKEVVSALRSALAEKVGTSRFRFWFGDGRGLSLEGNRLCIVVAHRMVQDLIRANYQGVIAAACRETLGVEAQVEFRIDPTLPAASPVPSDSALPSERSAQASAAPAVSVRTTQKAESPAPPLPPPPPQRFEEIVVGACNRMAAASAEMAAREPGRWSPLYLHGPIGVGKSQLLQAICHETIQQHPRMKVLYLTAEDFVSHYVGAVRGNGMPSFRNKCRNVDLLAIDDLQFLGNKTGTLRELLHTVEHLLRLGKQVVFASHCPPAELPGAPPELKSRLDGGSVCPMAPPDFATRLGIVKGMAAARSLHVGDEVLEYVASQLTAHARELSGALCRLHMAATSSGLSISRALAEEVLGPMVRSNSRVVGLAEIERAVCEEFGVAAEELQSDSRSKSITHPRMLAMWLARRYTRAALSDIGDYFRRQHSTVVSAFNRVNRMRANGERIESPRQRCSVDEAIARLEKRLLAV